MVQEMTRKSRSKRAYRRLFLAAAGFSLLLVIILAGMTAILVFAFKDTYAQRALRARLARHLLHHVVQLLRRQDALSLIHI